MRIYYSKAFTGGEEESRALLGEAIQRYVAAEGLEIGVPAEVLLDRIEKGPKGKPAILGFPPYSISHSGWCWAVLIAEHECGLDVQQWAKADCQRIARRFYNTDECASVFQNGDDEFFRIWARREAFRKAQGESVFTVGESVMFHVVETEETQETEEKKETSGSRRLWRIQDVELPLEVHAAVCVEVTAPEETAHQANAASADYEILVESL